MIERRPLPAVRNNLTDLAEALTDPEFGGFRPDHCTVLLDRADGDTVLRALYDNAKRATDTLWWRGALAYDEIRRVLLGHCRAANRIVILDCCFSGRAIPETAGADATGAFDIRGTYTLAAVGDNQFAYAPPGETHTAFTGELLKVLRDGVPQGPKLLTLNTIYLELDAALASQDLHRPRQNNNDTVAGLALARNPAYGHDEDRKEPRPRRPPQAAHTGLHLTATPVSAIPTKIAYALAFSPDGGSLAVATSTNTVGVFDTASWRQRLAVRQHWLGQASVFTVAFSPVVGLEFATGGSVVDGGMVRLWYTDDGSRGRKIAHGASVWAVTFSPDGEWLATGDSDGNVQIWNAGSGKLLMKVAHRDRVHGVAFSPDKRSLATGSSDGTVRIWDAYTGEQKTILVNEHSRAVAFSPDGRLLATASTPAQIWDAHTGTERFTLSPESGSSGRLCHDVAFSPDSRFLAAAYMDHTARIWDTHTGTELLKLTHDHEVRAVAFSPDGRWLAIGAGKWRDTMRRGPGTVHVWQLKEA